MAGVLGATTTERSKLAGEVSEWGDGWTGKGKGEVAGLQAEDGVGGAGGVEAGYVELGGGLPGCHGSGSGRDGGEEG